jgi:hypothetical protein
MSDEHTPSPVLWMQSPLPGLEPNCLRLTVNILVDGRTSFVEINACVVDPLTNEWVAATAPIWRGPITATDEMDRKLAKCVAETIAAVYPF